MSDRSDNTGGRVASMVVIDFESSHRMTICGLVSGWMTVRHSGCQSRITTASTASMRSTSSAAVRPRCGLRFHVRNDNAPIRIRAMMPIQSVTGVGER